MSWKQNNIKEEKIKFIADWLKGEFYFSELCKRYGISRKTGYKLTNRYTQEGEESFNELSRRWHQHPLEIPYSTRKELIELKYRYLHWGPAKIRDWLLLNRPEENWPAASTIGSLYERNGLVARRKQRRRVAAYSEPFSNCERSNQVWSADFKGHFKLGNAIYCYPLTISDNYSRYLLACQGLESPNTTSVQKYFEQVFYEHGLPEVIRTDNGQPFAGLGIGGLTRLSIWWLKLGILPERIATGHPEQNGRHERMHRTLKEATVNPAKKNMEEQQKCFDEFRREYNKERPHRGIQGKRPKDMYRRSNREMPQKVEEVVYEQGYEIRKVRTNGEIKWSGKNYYLSELLHGEAVGLKPIDEGRAMVYFGKLKLGLIDARKDKIIRP